MGVVTVFDLVGGAQRVVPGPDETTNWNAVSANGQPARLTVTATDTTGKPWQEVPADPTLLSPESSRTVELSGFAEEWGQLSELGARGPSVLIFVNDGPSPVTIAIH
jgi:hypothetical protein